MECDDGRRRLGRGLLAAGVRRPRGGRARAVGLRRGDHPRPGAGPPERDRHEQHRTRDHAARNRSAEAHAAPPDDARRRHLVPGHVRARGRLRPCLPAHSRGRVDGDDFVVNGQKSGPPWASGPVVPVVRAHRPGRTEAQGHLLPDPGHDAAGHRGSAAGHAERRSRLRRSVLQRRAGARGRPARSRERRLARSPPPR